MTYNQINFYNYHINDFKSMIYLYILGCISDNDCPEGKDCDKMNTNQCIPLTCKELTSKIGGSIKSKEPYASSKWFVGDNAEFCCEEGI